MNEALSILRSKKIEDFMRKYYDWRKNGEATIEECAFTIESYINMFYPNHRAEILVYGIKALSYDFNILIEIDGEAYLIAICEEENEKEYRIVNVG